MGSSKGKKKNPKKAQVVLTTSEPKANLTIHLYAPAPLTDKQRLREFLTVVGNVTGVADADLADQHTLTIRLARTYVSFDRAERVADAVLDALGLELDGNIIECEADL